MLYIHNTWVAIVKCNFVMLQFLLIFKSPSNWWHRLIKFIGLVIRAKSRNLYIKWLLICHFVVSMHINNIIVHNERRSKVRFLVITIIISTTTRVMHYANKKYMQLFVNMLTTSIYIHKKILDVTQCYKVFCNNFLTSSAMQRRLINSS